MEFGCKKNEQLEISIDQKSNLQIHPRSLEMLPDLNYNFLIHIRNQATTKDFMPRSFHYKIHTHHESMFNLENHNQL